MDDIINVNLLDNVYVHIECNVEQVHELKEYFSYYIPNYRYNPKVKARIWDGKVSFFNTMDRTLPIGLIHQLKDFLIKYDYKIHFNFKKSDLQNDITHEDLIPFYDALFSGTGIYPRDYQQQAIYKSLKHKRGVIEAATGAGKSIIIYTILRFMMEDTKGKILLVVPSINLVNQMFSDFKEYAWHDSYDSVTLLYGKSKHYDPDKRVTISTWQSIYKNNIGFFKQFSGVIVDETHGAKSISIQTVLKKCINAEYKLGLTGTLPTEDIDRMNIFGYLGPVIYKLKSKTLIDKGFLSNIRIVNLHIRYNDDEIKINKVRKYAEELDFIISHPKRNNVLKYIFDSKYVSQNDNVLILSHRLSHIDYMVEYLTELYPDKTILSITGNTDPEQRETIRKNIESGTGIILVATYGTLSTGVNIPKLHHVIFSTYYKSKIKVLQSIGRGLRKHKSKDYVILWDLVDDLRWAKRKKDGEGNIQYNNNYAYTHFLERIAYYKDQEFKYINKSIVLDKL